MGPEKTFQNRPPLVGCVNGYPSTPFQNLTTSDHSNSAGLGVGFPAPCQPLAHTDTLTPPLHPLPSTTLLGPLSHKHCSLAVYTA